MGIKGYIAIGSLAVAFGGGWAVNGWRLSGKIENLQAATDRLEVCEAWTETLTKKVDVLQGAIDDTNAALDKVKVEAEA